MENLHIQLHKLELQIKELSEKTNLLYLLVCKKGLV